MLSTVLIIDKRKELSTKYKKSLDSLELNAIVAKTLKDAMSLVQSDEPDMLIISDSIEENLGNFCQKIRALTYNTRPVIIALSKSADTNDRIEILESGADDFISEPVNIEEFKTRIKAHLRRDLESNLDSNTLLPTQKIVKKVLKRVLNSDNQAVLLATIRNLNKYKTIYTDVAGDKLIQTFVAIAKSALDSSDFIGQLDDNNFIIKTSKYGVEKLAEFLTFAFDTVAPKFYSPEDSARGYMLLKGERSAGMRVNFVSVLIGGIIDGFEQIGNTDLLIEKLKETRALATIPNGSNFAIERAKLTGTNSIVNNESNRNIYIKEDDESLNLLLRTSLELQGYDVQFELNLESAIQPSIIIMDSKDDLSGLEFLEWIKSNPNFNNTRIIVTTTVHDKTKILSCGADLYLPKPYEISDLIKWVEYFFRNN